jgi:hypothetical protein
MNYPEARPLGIEGSIEARPLIRSKLRGMDPRGIQSFPAKIV